MKNGNGMKIASKKGNKFPIPAVSTRKIVINSKYENITEKPAYPFRNCPYHLPIERISGGLLVLLR